MRRRSFLKSAASAFPLALTSGLSAVAAAADTPAVKQGHVVLAGEDLFGETRSRGFSRILFKTSTQETSGNLFIIEHDNLLAGGPPLHFHLEQEEWFYVMEGEVMFQVGDKRVHLKAGESLLAPRKVPHAFSGMPGKSSKMLIAFSPAGKMEQFFRDTAIPHGPVEDAAFFRKYDMELVGPPIKV